MDKKALEELEREIEYYKQHTKQQYRSHIGEYMRFVGNREWRDRDVLYNYIGKMKKLGHSQNYINYLVRGPIGALFRAHGLRTPVKLPKVSLAMVDLTTLVTYKPEEVEAFVKVAQKKGDPQWLAAMALSTTWGLRAGEIRQLRKEDIHLKPKPSIMIHTLKGGLPRQHLIPEQVQEYLLEYEYPLISDDAGFQLFHEIEVAAGVQHIPRKAYHAVRHSVFTGLIMNGLERSKAENFMRWRMGGTSVHYFSPQMFEIDLEAYPKHPHLKYWE